MTLLASEDFFVFQIEFVPGTTESKIHQYLSDVQQTLGLQLFQLHREHRELFLVASEHNIFDNRLLGILTSPSYAEHTKDMKLPYSIGFDAMRKPVVVDMVLYLSWLLGGAGFSGKTTGIQCLISSIIWSCSPEHVNLVIIDETANLTQFAALPHLSCPVIYSVDAGYRAIINLHKEMKQRLKLKNENPNEFNLQPIIVCIIDECVSFIAGTSDKQKSQMLADAISLILRLGRHVKIYLVLATQNSSLDEMKCDLSPVTSRIAFTCGKSTNSVTILGEGGADKLFGKGEMYFKSQRHSGLMYIKGALITSDEIEEVCNYIREKYEETTWNDRYKFSIDAASLLSDEEDTGDALITGSVTTTHDIEDKTFAKIIIWALGRETVSGNAIDQAFSKIGSRKAGKFIEKLYKLGVADTANAKLGRKVIPACTEDLSEEVIKLLNYHGYNAETIKEAFSVKQKDSDIAEDEVAVSTDEVVEADNIDTGDNA